MSTNCMKKKNLVDLNKWFMPQDLQRDILPSMNRNAWVHVPWLAEVDKCEPAAKRCQWANGALTSNCFRGYQEVILTATCQKIFSTVFYDNHVLKCKLPFSLLLTGKDKKNIKYNNKNMSMAMLNHTISYHSTVEKSWATPHFFLILMYCKFNYVKKWEHTGCVRLHTD